jgi:hypothetical protein
MDSIGDFTEMGDHFITAVPEVSTRQDRRRVDRYRFNDEHCCSPHRPFPIISEVPFAWNPLIGHISRVGSKNDTVAERLSAKVNGREKSGK